jgi:hypothetical protein
VLDVTELKSTSSVTRSTSEKDGSGLITSSSGCLSTAIKNERTRRTALNFRVYIHKSRDGLNREFENKRM